MQTPKASVSSPALAPAEKFGGSETPACGGLLRADFDPAPGLGAEGAAPGLVHYQTSDTLPPGRPSELDICIVDPSVSRQWRMRKSIITGARLLSQGMGSGGFRGKWAMLTLTYRPGQYYEPHDVTGLVKNIRTYLARRGAPLAGVWKLEMTKAGNPHYHVLIWLPKGITLPKPDKRGWWVKGMTKIEWARNAVGYIAKYASKVEAGSIPKGARLYGLLGLDAAMRCERNWWLAPRWVRDTWPKEHNPKRTKGGGWVSRLTGEHVRSRYQFHGFYWFEGRRCVKLIPAEWRQREQVDLTRATTNRQEIEMHEEIYRSMRLQLDRIGWLQEIETMTGSYQ